MIHDEFFGTFEVEFFDSFHEMRRALATVEQALNALYAETGLTLTEVEQILEREAPGLRRRLEGLWRQLDCDICDRRRSRKLSAAEVRLWREQLSAWQSAWKRAIEICLNAFEKEPAEKAVMEADYSAAA